MLGDRLNMRPLSPLNIAVVLSLLCALLFPDNAGAETTKKKITVLNVRIENDIGVGNAGPIATRWLIDSVLRVAPDVRVVTGKQAAELARLKSPLKAEHISPSVARALRKSIDFMEAHVFITTIEEQVVKFPVLHFWWRVRTRSVRGSLLFLLQLRSGSSPNLSLNHFYQVLIRHLKFGL